MKRGIALLCVLCLIALPSCSGRSQDDPTGEQPETYESYMENAVLRYPATDEHLRYTVYDTCATVTECLTDEPTVHIPATFQGVPVIAIEAGAFADCDTLERVVVGTNVLSVEERAFAGCDKLISIALSASVNTLGDSAFADCINLQTCTIPSAVQTIPSSLCSGCPHLRKVVIEPGTEGRTIQNGAFSGCTGLRAIWIPADVAEIHNEMLGSGTGEPAIYGEEATASARFAAEHRLDYGVMSRANFDVAVRAYEAKGVVEDSVGTELAIGDVRVHLDSAAFYRQIGSVKAKDGNQLLLLTFTVTNRLSMPAFFNPYGMTCYSYAADKTGVMYRYAKQAHFPSEATNLGQLAGTIAAGQSRKGAVFLEVNKHFDKATVQFPGSDKAFVIAG